MSKVLIAMDRSGSFRVHLTLTTDMCREAAHIHNTAPVATAGQTQGRSRVGEC